MTVNENECFDKDAFLSALRRSAALSGVDMLLTPEKEETMAKLCERLFSENRRYNLTAIKTPEKAAVLHFADSLTAARFLPSGASLIDIGAGGGFPSLPLAVARPDITVLAVDSTAKKVRYLNETAALFGISNLRALSARAEELAQEPRYREAFDVAIARAVAALPVLCELCIPFVKLGGHFLAMKGEAAESELREAEHAPRILGASDFRTEEVRLLGLEEPCTRFVLCAEKTGKTPLCYPRLYAKIQKSPLPAGAL